MGWTRDRPNGSEAPAAPAAAAAPAASATTTPGKKVGAFWVCILDAGKQGPRSLCPFFLNARVRVGHVNQRKAVEEEEAAAEPAPEATTTEKKKKRKAAEEEAAPEAESTPVVRP